MRRRAFTITELLVVIVILGVLAALLFPVFARAKQDGKVKDCQSRLKQFATALTLYRNDNDGKGFVWATYDGKTHRYPFNIYEPMAAYLKAAETVWCPEPSPEPEIALNFFHYRTWNDAPVGDAKHTLWHRPFVPETPQPIVYCANHVAGYDPRPNVIPYLRVGRYPFVRDDLSLGLADSRQITVEVYDLKLGWVDASHRSGSAVLRFPGEQWPPTPER